MLIKILLNEIYIMFKQIKSICYLIFIYELIIKCKNYNKLFYARLILFIFLNGSLFYLKNKIFIFE